jgi:DNA-binding XRE family transcriptional regulator
MMAMLRAIYAGGPASRWSSDAGGFPYYKYSARDGEVTFFFSPPAGIESRYHPSIAMYYAPRLRFVYSGSYREAVHNMSVETADVFLILMSRIADLRDPSRDIARISLEEIADMRGVHIRHGSTQTLYSKFREEIHRLADLRLRIAWKDYSRDRTVLFGSDLPDRLLDIVDTECTKGRRAWTSFRYRCGQSLSHFLRPEGLRWIGYYSRSLLRLNPYREAFIKKVGTYWTLLGIISGKKGKMPRATPHSILDFCSEEIRWRNPGQTLDSFFRAHDRLSEIGVLEEADLTEPLNRIKGYFREWLNTPLSVKLSEELWKIAAKHNMPLSVPDLPRNKRQSDRLPAPECLESILRDPSLIKQFRSYYYLRQEPLAKSIGITRQTLSNYERGLNPIPGSTAHKIMHIWQKESDAWE